jgi:hypothetical protein
MGLISPKFSINSPSVLLLHLIQIKLFELHTFMYNIKYRRTDLNVHFWVFRS